MKTVRHKIMDGRVQLFMRPDGPNWWCSCTIEGQQKRKSTGEESLAAAKDVARDWYLTLLGKLVTGNLETSTVTGTASLGNVSKFLSGDFKAVGKGKAKPTGMSFAEAADKFIVEFEAITRGERNARYIENHRNRIKNHLKPFFGDKVLSEITSGLVQDYRVFRLTSYKAEQERIQQAERERIEVGLPKQKPKGRNFKLVPPARSTLHQEVVCLRQVLAFAYRHRWLTSMPDLRAPYKSSGKIVQSRTLYSLRHTYISLRLVEGADIYAIAKNCRTSVEMIETYYASHIKNRLDAAAINVRKAKSASDKQKAGTVEK